MRQRYYDPGLGRWLSADPIGFSGGLNLYGYCGQNPTNGVDPLGLDPSIVIYYPSELKINWETLRNSIQQDVGCPVSMQPGQASSTGKVGDSLVVNLHLNNIPRIIPANGGGGVQLGYTAPQGKMIGSPPGFVSRLNRFTLESQLNKPWFSSRASACKDEAEKAEMIRSVLEYLMLNIAKHELGHALSGNPWEGRAPNGGKSVMDPVTQATDVDGWTKGMLPYDVGRIGQIRKTLGL